MMQPAVSSLTFLEQIKVFPRGNAEKSTFTVCHSVLYDNYQILVSVVSCASASGPPICSI